jgi:hypothetical protein
VTTDCTELLLAPRIHRSLHTSFILSQGGAVRRGDGRRVVRGETRGRPHWPPGYGRYVSFLSPKKPVASPLRSPRTR